MKKVTITYYTDESETPEHLLTDAVGQVLDSFDGVWRFTSSVQEVDEESTKELLKDFGYEF